MKAEQIINELEGLVKFRTCPSYIKDAFALIKSLQGEIRGLNSAIETLQGVVKDYEHRNENLVNENKYLRERLAEEAEHKKDMKGTQDD